MQGAISASVPLAGSAGANGLAIEPPPITDLLDIITVWADLSVRLAPASTVDEARVMALAELDHAALVLGRGPALDRLQPDSELNPGGQVCQPNV